MESWSPKEESVLRREQSAVSNASQCETSLQTGSLHLLLARSNTLASKTIFEFHPSLPSAKQEVSQTPKHACLFWPWISHSSLCLLIPHLKLPFKGIKGGNIDHLAQSLHPGQCCQWFSYSLFALLGQHIVGLLHAKSDPSFHIQVSLSSKRASIYAPPVSRTLLL